MKIPQYSDREFDDPVSDRQAAALQAICKFVRIQEGDDSRIEQMADHYRWTAPDGQIAAIGWAP